MIILVVKDWNFYCFIKLKIYFFLVEELQVKVYLGFCLGWYQILQTLNKCKWQTFYVFLYIISNSDDPIWLKFLVSWKLCSLLQNNNISGHIPRELGKLPNLETLDLSNNHFSGHVPDSLGLLNSLQYL